MPQINQISTPAQTGKQFLSGGGGGGIVLWMEHTRLMNGNSCIFMPKDLTYTISEVKVIIHNSYFIKHAEIW